MKFKITIVATMLLQMAVAQTNVKDSSFTISGVITATNNGISLFPNLSLNKPAVLFDLSLGKKRLTFDPMMRFNMNGKPWAFILWVRYKLIQSTKFNMAVGAHPSFVFGNAPSTATVADPSMIARRFFALEITPTYTINKKLAIGLHYLHANGLTKDVIQNSNFVALRAFITNVHLNEQVSISIMPQVYFLKMDNKQGTYYTAALNINSRKIPIGLNAVFAKAIKTTINGKNPIWSIGITHSFNKKYYKRKA